MLTGYKTVVFNSIMAALSVLVAADWVPLLPPQYAWVGLAVSSLGNLLLRYLTTTPIFQSAPAK